MTANGSTQTQELKRMSTNGNRLPPGPKGLPLVGLSFNLLQDPVELMRRVTREYGDIVRIPVILQSRILLNHPDYIQQLLLFQQSKFHKSTLTKETTERLLGQGLLISEGDFWRRQRRLAQPPFHCHRINEYAPPKLECAEMKARDWRDGDTRNMAEEMMELTLEAAVRTLFGTTLPGEAQQVGRAMTFLMRYSLRRARSPLRIPAGWPTPKNRRATKEFGFLDSLVYRIIEERKAQGNGHRHGDLLSMLMGAMDEDGTQMTPRQLRDETMTLFLAGHETTALTLSWTWYLLSQNPAAEARLHEELDGVLGGKPPTLKDLPALTYTDRVIKESMRLYPPAWSLAREVAHEFEVEGYRIPAGANVVMSQWILHRDRRLFEDPLRFEPDRWGTDACKKLPRFAYFPFGGGPRQCIGAGFATMEAVLLLATIAA